MGRYLQFYELEDLNSYCKSRCQKIIQEHTIPKVNYYRGQYKGYTYGIKVSSNIKNKKLYITHRKLYIIFKDAKHDILAKYLSDPEFKKGLLNSLYDLMNYVSMIKDTR